jgi:hypothetical protein
MADCRLDYAGQFYHLRWSVSTVKLSGGGMVPQLDFYVILTKCKSQYLKEFSAGICILKRKEKTSKVFHNLMSKLAR